MFWIELTWPCYRLHFLLTLELLYQKVNLMNIDKDKAVVCDSCLGVSRMSGFVCPCQLFNMLNLC